MGFTKQSELFSKEQMLRGVTGYTSAKIQGQKWGITWVPKLESLFNFWGSFWTLKEEKGMPISTRGYSSAGRAPALQAGGQRFDPAYLHQNGLIAQLVRASAW